MSSVAQSCLSACVRDKAKCYNLESLLGNAGVAEWLTRWPRDLWLEELSGPDTGEPVGL